MNIEMMRKTVKEYAADCSKVYEGGEEYFNEIDKKIKGNKDLLLSYIQIAVDQTGCKNIILSGGMFEAVCNAIKDGRKTEWNLYKISGNLRSYKCSFKCPPDFAFLYRDKDFVFVDDSFYSGKTYEQVKSFIESADGRLIAEYVFYDGSKDKRENIHSLYRYYNKEELDDSIDDGEEKKYISVLDENGRIVIPSDIKRNYNLYPGCKIEISAIDDDCIMLKKVYDRKPAVDLIVNAVDYLGHLVPAELDDGQLADIYDVLYETMKYLTEIIKE